MSTTTSEVFYSYWYHPESDAYLAIPSHEVDAFCETADGALCHSITLEDWLAHVSKPIELPNDPTIKGVLKNAKRYEHDKDILVGDLYYNRTGQFPEGIRIHTSRIQDIRSDGIYCTAHAKFYVIFAD